jgi:hypothetical protein
MSTTTIQSTSVHFYVCDGLNKLIKPVGELSPYTGKLYRVILCNGKFSSTFKDTLEFYKERTS